MVAAIVQNVNALIGPLVIGRIFRQLRISFTATTTIVIVEGFALGPDVCGRLVVVVVVAPMRIMSIIHMERCAPVLSTTRTMRTTRMVVCIEGGTLVLTIPTGGGSIRVVVINIISQVEGSALLRNVIPQVERSAFLRIPTMISLTLINTAIVKRRCLIILCHRAIAATQVDTRRRLLVHHKGRPGVIGIDKGMGTNVFGI